MTAGQAALEFRPNFTRGLTVAAYAGMLVGALFWGLGADVIGSTTRDRYTSGANQYDRPEVRIQLLALHLFNLRHCRR